MERSTVVAHWVMVLICAALSLVLTTATGRPEQLQPGGNKFTVRGEPQDIYHYPGGAEAGKQSCLLFASGDGGWRGFAVTMAETMASWGYDVYGLDTKHYLASFTGRTTLKEPQVMEDVLNLAKVVTREERRVILIGWSEGAGLFLLAAAQQYKDPFAGLVAVGLGDFNVLGWRFRDNFTYLTKKEPHEPSFSAAAYVSRVCPLPLAVVQSTHDEYVPKDESDHLFSLAKEPKRLFLVEAENHRFDGNQEEFFRLLKEALIWIRQRTDH